MNRWWYVALASSAVVMVGGLAALYVIAAGYIAACEDER